jgi:carboxymethylenebutenolidase
MKRSLRVLAAVSSVLACALHAQETIEVPWNDAIPPGTESHIERALQDSTRHGEWIDIALPGDAKLNTWVVYPERPDKAGVVLVIHDIRGMSDWIRAVGDQLAQDGFIAVVPDFLSGKGPEGRGTASLESREVGQAIRKLTAEEVVARLDAAKLYASKLPAANGKLGVIGFCWGGTQSFQYALAQPKLDAAVVFYGSLPGVTAEQAPLEDVAKIQAPVLGLYAGNDARINATLPPTIAAMMAKAKTYEFHTFEGAGHGFVGRQDRAEGNNLRATQQAWPLTISFLQRHLK